MKKVFVAATVGIFALGMFSCGHGVCDAYNKADYTEYKKEQNKKVEVLQNLSETQSK